MALSLTADPPEHKRFRGLVNKHLALGHGIHFCIGAMLAREELELGSCALLRRLDDLRLAPGGSSPRHRPSVLLRGLGALPIAFRRRT